LKNYGSKTGPWYRKQGRDEKGTENRGPGKKKEKGKAISRCPEKSHAPTQDRKKDAKWVDRKSARVKTLQRQREGNRGRVPKVRTAFTPEGTGRTTASHSQGKQKKAWTTEPARFTRQRGQRQQNIQRSATRQGCPKRKLRGRKSVERVSGTGEKVGGEGGGGNAEENREDSRKGGR